MSHSPLSSNSSPSVTRRTLLVCSASVGAAVASGFSARGARADEADAPSGANVPSFMNPPAAVAEEELSETIEADVLVVGAGIAGMCAARAAAEEGARVIVVEKAAHPMCRGNFGKQIGAIDSSYQRTHGIKVDKRALVERFQRDTMQMSNQYFIQYWADHSGETVDWCLAACPDVVEMDLGARGQLANLADGQVGIFGYADEEGYDPISERYPAFNTQLVIGSNNTELNEGGFSLMLEHFQQIVESLGGRFLFNTFGRYLEKDEDAVTGLVAQRQDGAYVRVRAKSTVLACGDFASDTAMVAHYAPQAAGLLCLFNGTDCEGNPCNTGDGHKLALWAGAHMEDGPYAPMAHLSALNNVLLVNRKGERVCNEDLGAQSITDVVLRQPGKQIFVVSGASQGSVVLDPGPFGKPCEEPFDDFETMAAAIGEHCDPAVLQATVERYNELCAAGADADFGKDPRYLTPLDAPYYVTPSGPGNLLVIMGGIACDNDCRALDADDVAIPGLFVVGNTQGGRFGAEYPMTAPGISHGIAATLGRYVGGRAVKLAE